MKKTFLLLSFLVCVNTYAQDSTFVPITKRVDIQTKVAPANAIIDNQWVAVGSNKVHTIGYDYSKLFQSKPSFRFTLKKDDNTIPGHAEGETKGRAELSYCYATADEVKNMTKEELHNEELAATVYFSGKGWCHQASKMYYRFSVFMPDTIALDIKAIFAQWHGMPDRTLLKTAAGVIRKVTKAEFALICDTMYFVQEKGYDKKTRQPNGWIIQEGGFPPLSFGVDSGFFYILANSDRKWFSDINDRCLANVKTGKVLQPVKSEYKESTLAYKAPFADFPKNKWVTFYVNVEWTKYYREKEDILKSGCLDVMMSYEDSQQTVIKHIVNNADIMLGANNLQGYYFKFGIYRTASNTVPVSYNLTNYAEQTYPFKQH